jgi:hypothetical protein
MAYTTIMTELSDVIAVTDDDTLALNAMIHQLTHGHMHVID